MEISMRRNLLIVLWIGLALMAYGCNGKETEKEPKTGLTKQAALSARKVSVQAVQRKDFARSFRSTGSLNAEDQATLRALIEGPLDEVSVDIGDSLKAGQVVFRTRDIDARLAMQTSQAALNSAQAALDDLKAWKRKEEVESLRADVAQSQADYERLEVERQRARKMLDSNTISDSEWDTAKASADMAQARLRKTQEQLKIAESGPTKEQMNVAETKVSQAQASLAQAQQALTDCEVRTPFDCAVTKRLRKRGDYAKKGDEVVQITNLSVLRAEMFLPAVFATDVTPGLKVTMKLESSELERAGKIVAVNPSVEQKTRTFLVKVEVDNADHAIKAGAFGIGLFELPPSLNAIAAPMAAVKEEDGRTSVWISDQGKAKRVYVKTGERDKDWVEIEDGLKDNDLVVTKGGGMLAEGDELDTSEAQPPASAKK